MRYFNTFLLFILSFSFAYNQNAAEIGIIPYPKSINEVQGYLNLSGSSRIVYSNSSLQPLADILKQDIQKITGLNLAVTGGGSNAGDIELALNSGLPTEGYTLNVDSKIVITGKDYRAAVWGTSTLLQTMNSNGSVKMISVNDSPDTDYRGLMVDLARQFHPVQNIEDIINMCRLYKINYLHLHLMDSQFFTFPSQAYPLLATPGFSYSVAELNGLEAYSQARGVTIVPELEVPGHAGRMIQAYPNLFGSGTDGAINIARADVRAAVGTLVGEIANVFQATPYFHIGCDEVDKSGMGQHPDYINAIAQLGVGDVNGLFNYFINQTTGYVEAQGKRAMAWEGFDSGRTGAAEVNKNLIVCPFDNYVSSNSYAANGHDILNTSWFPLYLVPNTYVPPSKVYNWELAQFGNYNGASPRSHTNVNQYLMADTGRLIGAQTCSWEQQADFEIPSLRSRLSPMSERVWNTNAGLTFSNYQSRFVKSDQVLTKILASDLPGSITPSASFEVFSDKISISWRPEEEYPSSYTLYRSTSDNSGTTTPILSNTTLTAYEDFNVNAGQTYYYWVKGINSIGIGAFGGSADGRLGNASLTMSHEPFEYSGNSSPNGQNGGIGFNGAWTITDFAGSASITSQSLNYTNLQTSGNSFAINLGGASTSFNMERSLAGSLCPEGSEVWVSFLIRANSIGVGHLFLGLGNAPIGKVWGNGIEIPGVVNAQHALETGVTSLVVMKIKSYNGNDDIHIWTNPLVNGIEPDINASNCYFTDRTDFGTNPKIGINVQHHGEGSYELDEVRIGDSFDDVLPPIDCDIPNVCENPCAIICFANINNQGWQSICDVELSAGQSVTFGPQVEDNPSGTWLWEGPGGFTSTSREITVSTYGVYAVTFSSAICTYTQSIVVNNPACNNGGGPANNCQYTTDNASYINTCDITVCEGEKLVYTYSGCDGNLSLNLIGANGFNENSVGACGEILVSNSITPDMAGTYTATLTDITTGCFTVQTVTITVLPFSNNDCPDCTVGATCDDNNACTTNDVYDDSCNCNGTVQGGANCETVNGTVWVDSNGDGVRSGGEGGIPNVTVRLFYDNNGDGFVERIISTVQADQNGNYVLSLPGSGKYQIGIDPLSLPDDKYRLTTQSSLGSGSGYNYVSSHTFRSDVLDIPATDSSILTTMDIGILQGDGNLIFLGNGEVTGQPVHQWLFQDIHFQIQDTGLDPNDSNYRNIIETWLRWYAVGERITQEAEILPNYLDLARHNEPGLSVSVKYFHTVDGLGSYASGRGAVSSGIPATTLLNNPNVIEDHILMFYETTRGANPIWKYRSNWPFGARLTHHSITSMTLLELGGMDSFLANPNVTPWNPGRDGINNLDRWERTNTTMANAYPIDPALILNQGELVNHTSIALPDPDAPGQTYTIGSRDVLISIIVKVVADFGREKAIEIFHNMSRKSWYSPSRDQGLIHFKQALNDATDGFYAQDLTPKWGFPSDATYNNLSNTNSGNYVNQTVYNWDLKPHNYASDKIRPGYSHLSDRTTQGFVKWIDSEGSNFRNLGARDFLKPLADITYPNQDAHIVVGEGVSFAHQLENGTWTLELNVENGSPSVINFQDQVTTTNDPNVFTVVIQDGELNMNFNSQIRLAEISLSLEDSICLNEGLVCDDGDPCTVNDVLDSNCDCIGISSDLEKFDDRGGVNNYRGGWTEYSGDIYYQGTCTVASSDNASIEFDFTGSYIAWHGLRNSDLGIAEVWIDNELIQTVDCYSSTRSTDKLFEQLNLSSGAHTIRVVRTGQQNPSSTGAFLVHDYFEVGAPCNGLDIFGQDQIFYIEAVTNDKRLAIDCQDFSVAMDNANDVNSQKWRLIGSEGNFALQNMASGEYLVIPSNTCGNGVTFGTNISSIHANERWNIQLVEGYYYIKPLSCSTHGLDHAGPHLWNFGTANPNQRFRLISTTISDVSCCPDEAQLCDDNDSCSDTSVFDVSCNCNPMTNYALEGTASMNSAYNGTYIVERLNDGVYDHNNYAHTQGSSINDWMQVDLGEVKSIKQIAIWNRTDCCTDRVSKCYLMVSDTPFPNNTDVNASLSNADFTYQFAEISKDALISIPVDMSARYVRIQKSGDNPGGNYLNLGEIGVFGEFASDCVEECADVIVETLNNEVIQSTAAAISIESNQIIPDNADIEFSAGEYILLESGFEVKPNGIFHAYIEACK